MSDPIQKSTQKANKVADWLSGWSRTTQGLIGLVSSLAIILGSLVAFGGDIKDWITEYSQDHAKELMNEGVNEISERVANDVILALLPYIIDNKASLDSLKAAQNFANKEFKALKSDMDAMSITQWKTWHIVNDMPPPSEQEIEIMKLRKELEQERRNDSITAVQTKEHTERLEKLEKKFQEQIKTGDRTP